MIEHPETPPTEANIPSQPLEPPPQTPQMQGKLVLPAYDSWKYQTGSKSMPAVRPEQLVRPTTPPPPTDPLARLRYFWRKDPAYKVLFIAIGMVLAATVVFASMVSAALAGHIGLFDQANTYAPNAPTSLVPTATLDLHPKFPTPSGGKGSGSSSQPPPKSTPTLVDTPAPTPTPTAESSPTPNPEGNLTLQITSIPTRVTNDSAVYVQITANQPNVIVQLYIIYNTAPYRAYAGPTVTDANGDATITWYVSVYKFGGARANVTAIARDGNDQRVMSQTVTVQIEGVGQ